MNKKPNSNLIIFSTNKGIELLSLYDIFERKNCEYEKKFQKIESLFSIEFI
jgi:hypothetical protein